MPGSEIATIETFIGHYGGYLGLLISIVVLFILIPLRDKWLPSVIKRREQENQEKMDRVREDVEFHRAIERERVQSANVTAEAIRRLSDAMIQTNERIAMILDNQMEIQRRQTDTLSALNTAVTEMKERVAHKAGYEERKRETGPMKAQPDDKPK